MQRMGKYENKFIFFKASFPFTPYNPYLNCKPGTPRDFVLSKVITLL